MPGGAAPQGTSGSGRRDWRDAASGPRLLTISAVITGPRKRPLTARARAVRVTSVAMLTWV